MIETNASQRESPATRRKSTAGQQIKFSKKERSQIMENDRFMMTKKVIVDKLPDTNGIRPKINTLAPIFVERSAADVHEAYLQKVQELRMKKIAEDEAKFRAAAQESMIRNFVKKPTLTGGQHNSSNDVDADNSI